MIAVSYGSVFVGQISLGANPLHALKTIRLAESYRGTSIIIAFSHCIGWGIDMTTGMSHQKEAVACGYWPLYHYDPRDAQPFHLASKRPTGEFKEFALKEARFAMLHRSKPEQSDRLLALGQQDLMQRYELYEHMSTLSRDAVAAEAAKGGNGSDKTQNKEVSA
jgi:pyruvate-ferredoxin/flavodoxin oxidoreductase